METATARVVHLIEKGADIEANIPDSHKQAIEGIILPDEPKNITPWHVLMYHVRRQAPDEKTRQKLEVLADEMLPASVEAYYRKLQLPELPEATTARAHPQPTGEHVAANRDANENGLSKGDGEAVSWGETVRKNGLPHHNKKSGTPHHHTDKKDRVEKPSRAEQRALLMIAAGLPDHLQHSPRVSRRILQFALNQHKEGIWDITDRAFDAGTVLPAFNKAMEEGDHSPSRHLPFDVQVGSMVPANQHFRRKAAVNRTGNHEI